MRVVDRADTFPNQCVVTGRIDGPFVDTEMQMSLDRFGEIFFHRIVVEEAAGLFGMATESQVDELHTQIQKLVDVVEAQRSEIEQLTKFKESVDTLVSHDFATRKKPGRPRKETDDQAE